MKRTVKNALRNILPSNNDPRRRPTRAPPPSDPIITLTHIYATDPAGNLIKYPGPPISLVPVPYKGGHLRYNANSSAVYRAGLANLVRVAKMTLVFAESSSGRRDLSKVRAEVEYEEAGNGVECKLLPLLNIQSRATEMGSTWVDMDTGKFVHALSSSSATWGVNLSLVVRWKEGRVRQKPLPPLPTVGDEELIVEEPRRSVDTIWPGPNAPW